MAERFDAAGMSNPILPGYFADPSVLNVDGTFYVYATFDPWGFDALACWTSTDFKNWTLRPLNWPTKQACTSRTSGGSKVWAPSVVRGRDGKFYMYVSVGSEVWVGTADAPLGPWRNALPDNRPLVSQDFDRRYHMIDAECFIDDDGQAYLFWGSGWNYTNGHCFVVKLKPDMVSFDGTPQDVTPANYFEAPFVIKRGGVYYMMYSNGKVGEDSYRVHYARADKPMGPYTEGPHSPVLTTHKDRNVSGPGHHAVYTFGGVDYFVYHRNATDRPGAYRQTCVDVMTLAPDGAMNVVEPTHDGARALQAAIARATDRELPLAPKNLLAGATITASSSAGEKNQPKHAVDDNYSTRWVAGAEKQTVATPWIAAAFDAPTQVARVVLRPEFGDKPYRVVLEASDDGATWRTLTDHTADGIAGSPITFNVNASVRGLRLRYADGTPGDVACLFEWRAE